MRFTAKRVTQKETSRIGFKRLLKNYIFEMVSDQIEEMIKKPGDIGCALK